jgi:hypothetical protein
MNNAEKEFWGSNEKMEKYLRSVRQHGEELDGFDDRPSVDEAIIFAEVWGEACETLLAELLKMKNASNIESKPKLTAQELAVAEINKLVAV